MRWEYRFRSTGGALVLVEWPEMVRMPGRVVDVVLDVMLQVRVLRVRRLGMLGGMCGRCKCRRSKAIHEDQGQQRDSGNLLHGPNVARTTAGRQVTEE